MKKRKAIRVWLFMVMVVFSLQSCKAKTNNFVIEGNTITLNNTNVFVLGKTNYKEMINIMGSEYKEFYEPGLVFYTYNKETLTFSTGEQPQGIISFAAIDLDKEVTNL